MLKKALDTMIALFFAFLLKGITYAVGPFNFIVLKLFSFDFLWDLIITLIYYSLFLFIIYKIRNKNRATYSGKAIKDMQKNGLRIYLDGEDVEISVKSDDELFVMIGFINDDDKMRGFSMKRI